MNPSHDTPSQRQGLAAEVAEVLDEVLSAEQDVAFAYLFGSVAKGRTRGASDVDVAVFLSDEEAGPSGRLVRALDLEGQLESALNRAVQVVVLNDAPLDLRFNVLHHGIPLSAQNPAARARFFVSTGRQYYDMAPARKLFQNRQLERIRKGTFGG